MSERTVVVDGRKLIGRDSFHDEFAAALGFPDFYGRNMDAWIDCMTRLDAPEDGMSKVTVSPGQVLTLRIDNYSALKEAAPKQWLDLLECSAFVNWRRVEQGDGAVVALAFYG